MIVFKRGRRMPEFLTAASVRGRLSRTALSGVPAHRKVYKAMNLLSGQWQELVPAFYRRIQRIQDPEALLHALTAFAPAEAKPQLPESSPPPTPAKTNPADEVSWKIACKTNTAPAYQGYLDKWKNGLHAAEAAERIEDLTNDQYLWDYLNAHSAGDALEDNLREYFEAYPAGLHAKEAQERIATFEREREAEAARIREAQEEAERKRKEAEETEKRRAEAEALPDFHLCKYPVTQAQWKKIMGDNPSYFKGDDLPVEQVSWDDAQAFLKKLNATLPAGQKPYRLPSEAEWEYAAKGGNQSKGFEYAGSNDLKEVGWYWENSGDKPLSGNWNWARITANNCKTHPVGRKKPNELGLYDMSGTVWEWCQDVWHEDLKGTPADGSARTSGGDQSRRVVRSGSWNDYSNNCRAAARGGDYTDNRNDFIGFRLAR